MAPEGSTTKKKIFDGRYEILAIVGRGASSVVYHARHANNPAVEVALKVLLNKDQRRSTADLLRKEALAMVSSRHRYVIRLDDFHSVGQLCYLSMEFAPESDLRKYLKKMGGNLPAVQAQRFLLQCAEALSFMHKAGIIHRDVKPENLLVVNQREIRIADFGLAVLPGDESSMDELQKGVGTMSYMPPEVLNGERYDERSDLYSLGVSFYEVLSGVHPFEKAPLAEQLNVRADKNIPDLKVLVPEAPEQLTGAIMKSLRFKAEQRFEHLRDFIEAIKRTGAGKPAPRRGARHQSARQEAPAPGPSSKASGPVKPEAVPQPEVSAGRPPLQESASGQPAPTQPIVEKKSVPDPQARAQQAPSSPRTAPPEKFQNVPSSQAGNAAIAAPEVAAAPSSRPGFASSIMNNALEAADEAVDATVARPHDHTRRETLQRGPRKEGGSSLNQPSDHGSRPNGSRRKAQASNHPNKRKKNNRPKSEPLTKKAEPVRTSNQAALTDPKATPAREGANGKKKRIFFTAAIVIFLVLVLPVVGREVNKLTMKYLNIRVTPAFLDSDPDPVAPDLLPRVSTNEFEFPYLASGVYSGKLEGFWPGRDIPFTLISLSEQRQIIALLGIEGWTPKALDLPEPGSAPVPTQLRIASNGVMLDITGQNVDGELIGFFRNIVTGGDGSWKAVPVS